jgi:hypothetical protein
MNSERLVPNTEKEWTMAKARTVMTLVVAIGSWWIAAISDAQTPMQVRRESSTGGSIGAASVPKPLLKGVASPQYGTEDYEITVVPASRFYQKLDYPTLSGYCLFTCPNGFHAYEGLDLPAGVVIDYIGVNSSTTGDAILGFTLHFRDHLGGTAQLVSRSIPAHGFATDYTEPLGILVPSNLDRVFILDLEQAPGVPNSDQQFFGYFEIWWRRIVSDPPVTPTFADVPTSNTFYPFIEALAASGITGGCGGGNFCPDAPLKRGQMAAFLAKALGLHWPN